MNFLGKVMKKNVRPFKVWLSTLLFTKKLLKTARLLSKDFPSGLSLCIIYFLFHKGKDTSAISQPSIQHLVYVFPIFSRFRKCFNNFHLSKNILINKAICKSRNGELRNGMKGMMGIQRIWVRMWGIWGIWVGMRGIEVGMWEIRVGMRGIGVGMRGI